MVLRTARRGEAAGERYWGCSRYPTCRGTRSLPAPRQRTPGRRGKTAQQLFQEQRQHVWAGRRRRLELVLVGAIAGAALIFVVLSTIVDARWGITGALVWLCAGLVTLVRLPGGAAAWRGVGADESPSDKHLSPLWDLGFVGLHDRRAPAGRERIDHLVIGSTGVHVVEMKSWPGQLAVDGDRLYVDGRLREGAADNVLRAAAAVADALVGELKPLGVSVTPVLCFDRADMPRFQRRVRGVEVTGGRSLPHAIRSRPEVLTPEQVLTIATAADEVFLPPG